MAATSAVDDAENGLLAILLARQAQPGSALAGVPIDLGDPGEALMTSHVWIAEAVTATQEWATTGLGAQQRREEFPLEVHVLVEEAGNDYTSLRDAVQALAEEAAAAVRGDWTLMGAVWHAQVGGISRATGATAKGRGAELVVRVDVLAFVT